VTFEAGLQSISAPEVLARDLPFPREGTADDPGNRRALAKTKGKSSRSFHPASGFSSAVAAADFTLEVQIDRLVPEHGTLTFDRAGEVNCSPGAEIPSHHAR